jgi:putative aminopeptidase FrvX
VTRDSIHVSLVELCGRHSPSGAEQEVDAYLLERLAGAGRPAVDGAGNIVLRVAGRGEGPPVALLAHKDEIGGLVKRVEENGRLVAVTLGDAHPWIWGEGVVEVLGRRGTLTGVLSYGARHVSEESPQRKQLDEEPVRWRNAWIETKLDAQALEAAGVTAGSRVVPARSRKAPVRLGAEGEFVAAHALDNKGSVAALLELASSLSGPRCDVDLVFTSREEIGCHGAQWYARRTDAEALVAVEVVPVAKEYAIDPGPVRADAHGPLDDSVADELEDAATAAGLRMRHCALTRYGSDASQVLSTGRIARSACLAFATENTHGFEIAHLDGIASCVTVLERWLA